jgi:hypothetical protein
VPPHDGEASVGVNQRAAQPQRQSIRRRRPKSITITTAKHLLEQGAAKHLRDKAAGRQSIHQSNSRMGGQASASNNANTGNGGKASAKAVIAQVDQGDEVSKKHQ